MKTLEKLTIAIGFLQLAGFFTNYLFNPGFSNPLSGANWFGGLALLAAPVNLVLAIICLSRQQKYGYLGILLTLLATVLILGLHWNINIAPGNNF